MREYKMINIFSHRKNVHLHPPLVWRLLCLPTTITVATDGQHWFSLLFFGRHSDTLSPSFRYACWCGPCPTGTSLGLSLLTRSPLLCSAPTQFGGLPAIVADVGGICACEGNPIRHLPGPEPFDSVTTRVQCPHPVWGITCHCGGCGRYLCP